MIFSPIMAAGNRKQSVLISGGTDVYYNTTHRILDKCAPAKKPSWAVLPTNTSFCLLKPVQKNKP